MADKRITALNKLLEPQEEDLLLIVDDALVNPVNKRITVGDLFNKQSANIYSTSTFNKQRVKRDATVRRDVNLRNETVVEQPVAISVTGVDDLVVPYPVGTYTGSEPSVYIIEIDDASSSPNTFKWSKDGGSYTSAQSCTIGDGLTLSDGINVAFTSTTGHTLGDKWYITATPQSKIDFGQGSLILEDDKPNIKDFSSEGSLILESGVDIRLEESTYKDLYITSNTTTISIVGDQLLGNTTNKIGFFGNAPVSKNTSTLTTVSEVIAELTRLGLIGT